MSKAGRPRAAPATVRISKAGVIRLSADLCISDRFNVWIDEATKLIEIKPTKEGGSALWRSNKFAQCGLLSAVRVLRTLEKPPTPGEYSAEVEGNQISIDLRKRRKK
jgi:hypothetical protein